MLDAFYKAAIMFHISAGCAVLLYDPVIKPIYNACKKYTRKKEPQEPKSKTNLRVIKNSNLKL